MNKINWKVRFNKENMLPNKNWSLLYDRLDSSLYTLHNIHPQGAVKKAQQSPWISSIWKPTGFNISHSKKELSNLEKRVQQTQRHKNCVFADY